MVESAEKIPLIII